MQNRERYRESRWLGVIGASMLLTLGMVAVEATPQVKPGSGVLAEGAEPLIPSIEGRWYSFFGFMDLEQDGHEFSGTYSCCDGVITGTVSDEDVAFTWSDPIYGKGWGSFKLRKDQTMLVGVWGKEDDFGSRGTWNAFRFDEPEVKGEISRFTVTTEHPAFGSFEGTAVVGIEGESVTGKLEGVFKTPAKDGLFYRDEVLFPLEGSLAAGRLTLEWEDPRNEELGSLELSKDEADWSGEWEAHRTDRRVAMVWTPIADSP